MSDELDSRPPRRRGRKPRVPGEPVTSFEFRLSESEKADLKAVARENDTHASDFVREAVNEAVADYRERRLFQRTKRQRRVRARH